MKLSETTVGFNSELLGRFVLIEGTDHDGEEITYRGYVQEVEKHRMSVIVLTDPQEKRSYVNSFNVHFYYRNFFPTEDSDELYELSVYFDTEKVEVD